MPAGATTLNHVTLQTRPPVRRLHLLLRLNEVGGPPEALFGGQTIHMAGLGGMEIHAFHPLRVRGQLLLDVQPERHDGTTDMTVLVHGGDMIVLVHGGDIYSRT